MAGVWQSALSYVPAGQRWTDKTTSSCSFVMPLPFYMIRLFSSQTWSKESSFQTLVAWLMVSSVERTPCGRQKASLSFWAFLAQPLWHWCRLCMILNILYKLYRLLPSHMDIVFMPLATPMPCDTLLLCVSLTWLISVSLVLGVGFLIAVVNTEEQNLCQTLSKCKDCFI